MDPIATALTNAWLSAVARLRLAPSALPKPADPPHTLTATIEAALRRDSVGSSGSAVDYTA